MEMSNRSTNIDELSQEQILDHGGQSMQQYLSAYMTKVYGWMFTGLMLTGLVGWWAASSPMIIQLVFGNRFVFFGLVILELFLVGFLSARIQKMSLQSARMIFLAYSLLNGITFSIFFIAFTPTSIITVFGITAGTFGIMSAVGYFTHQDLSKFGSIMMMGLIGIVLASVVNIFMQNPTMYYIISFIGVAVFVGLVAYDTQKIKSYALLSTEEDRQKGAVMGALALYLDFINLFIFLLRIFGRRN